LLLLLQHFQGFNPDVILEVITFVILLDKREILTPLYSNKYARSFRVNPYFREIYDRSIRLDYDDFLHRLDDISNSNFDNCFSKFRFFYLLENDLLTFCDFDDENLFLPTFQEGFDYNLINIPNPHLICFNMLMIFDYLIHFQDFHPIHDKSSFLDDSNFFIGCYFIKQFEKGNSFSKRFPNLYLFSQNSDSFNMKILFHKDFHFSLNHSGYALNPFIYELIEFNLLFNIFFQDFSLSRSYDYLFRFYRNPFKIDDDDYNLLSQSDLELYISSIESLLDSYFPPFNMIFSIDDPLPYFKALFPSYDFTEQFA